MTTPFNNINTPPLDTMVFEWCWFLFYFLFLWCLRVFKIFWRMFECCSIVFDCVLKIVVWLMVFFIRFENCFHKLFVRVRVGIFVFEHMCWFRCCVVLFSFLFFLFVFDCFFKRSKNPDDPAIPILRAADGTRNISYFVDPLFWG